ncbi:hypothetical protein [Methanocorpusculum parvum]|uniref:Apea-like HEPN domain-containing protein n=1 Tax=Methanocorpusculum parvum TaxID=2193 RepID=A0AAX0Q8C2_9EURY|nr:hypothetical protein [Methanocorpusculum parvum]PAV09268.1 hypothetical protein ASJ83_08385 [Methanocorpusculum parvum]
MDNFYIIVNEAFLATVDLKSQQKLKEIINQDINSVGIDTDSRRCYIRLCPYCNAFGVVNCRKFENDDSAPCGLFEIGDSDSTFPNTCVFCGETAPSYKIKQSVKKCQILYDLSLNCSSTDGAPKNNQNERVLLEQCVVILATGIELFLKDTYVLSMNLKYVKPELTLNRKFSRDVKNEFLNIDKAVRIFKDEFEIDLKEILGKETIKKLNLLMSMRNVIVHNNGILDQIFRERLTEDLWAKYPIASNIPITENDIIEFIDIIKLVFQKIEMKFDEIIVPEIQKRIEINLQNF